MSAKGDGTKALVCWREGRLVWLVCRAIADGATRQSGYRQIPMTV